MNEATTLTTTTDVVTEQDKGRCAPAPGSAKLRYILDADLGDGVHPTVVQDHAIILESVKEWLENATEGEAIKIGTRMMTDREVEALPDL